jgi:hypothetical protein
MGVSVLFRGLSHMQARYFVALALSPSQIHCILLMRICWGGGSLKGNVIQAVSMEDLRNRLMSATLGGYCPV